jgi:hypothetical protein
MDLTNEIGRCRHCRTVIDAGRVATAGIDQEPSRPKALPQGSMPSGLKVDDSGSGLVIVWRWFSVTYIVPAFLCVLLDGFLVFVYLN